MMIDKQQALFAAGHDLFLAQGFKATNIAQIAKRAHVAVGTFYRYYDSKEALFIKVYNQENEAVKAKIIADLDLKQAPATVVQALLQAIFTQTAHNAILQAWFTEPKLNALIAASNTQAITESVVYATFLKLLTQWQAQGLLKPDVTKDRALSLFNALIVVDLHQNELAVTDYYQLLQDLITGLLAVILK